MRITMSFSSVLRHSSPAKCHTRQTSHLIRRREDDKSGVFKGAAARPASAPDAHAASADVAPAADAAPSDSESSGAVEGAIPFRTCSDACEVQYGVMKGMLLQ